MRGDIKGIEGACNETTWPCVVFERMAYYTTVLVRGLCIYALH